MQELLSIIIGFTFGWLVRSLLLRDYDAESDYYREGYVTGYRVGTQVNRKER